MPWSTKMRRYQKLAAICGRRCPPNLWSRKSKKVFHRATAATSANPAWTAARSRRSPIWAIQGRPAMCLKAKAGTRYSPPRPRTAYSSCAKSGRKAASSHRASPRAISSCSSCSSWGRSHKIRRSGGRTARGETAGPPKTRPRNKTTTSSGRSPMLRISMMSAIPPNCPNIPTRSASRKSAPPPPPTTPTPAPPPTSTSKQTQRRKQPSYRPKSSRWARRWGRASSEW